MQTSGHVDKSDGAPLKPAPASNKLGGGRSSGVYRRLPLKVLIAGGGTGGHLFPGVALAEELTERRLHEVLFVGTARGIEARVLPREGYPLELIDASGLKRMGWGKLSLGLARLPRAFWQSTRIIQKFRPDVVVGVGGYASGPVVLAASLLRIPTAILEQNSVPGFTNRALGRVVRRIFTAFAEAGRYFPKAKVRQLGNPVRKRIRESLPGADPQATTRSSGDGRPLLLVCGGSQGARAVNDGVIDALALLQSRGQAPRVLHQTGEADRQRVVDRYAEQRLAAEVVPFIDDMAAAYRRAAVVVGRAGATTLAELTAMGVPAILIPFPFAADDHQTVNAQALVAAGAARMFRQDELSAELLAQALERLLSDAELRGRMAAAMRTLGRPDAARAIVDELEQLAVAQRSAGPAGAAEGRGGRPQESGPW
jgi:UDP-N-acetylglucosamine--N-acetylmuramyl-(pentapeptide) pyrophosphoryl-undecaprenol N-acetylglucosamine transferase